MARQISIKEEYLGNCDEATLQAVLQALRGQFLLITLEDGCIEVDEQDYEAVSRELGEIKHDIEINNRRLR